MHTDAHLMHMMCIEHGAIWALVCRSCISVTVAVYLRLGHEIDLSIYLLQLILPVQMAETYTRLSALAGLWWLRRGSE